MKTLKLSWPRHCWPLCAGLAEEAVLKVSAIPDEAPTELQRKFAPLGQYLEKQLGMKVQFVPVTDYAAVVTALNSDKIDMAWLGGFTLCRPACMARWCRWYSARKTASSPPNSSSMRRWVPSR
jgi:phosphonate transport system substrate-binding protein